MTEPQMLGKYQIIEEIGRGGFATVYRALDTVLEREVALKVLKPGWTDDAKAVERFMREARAASRLDQPGIVTIYDVGSADGRLFIAMKLLAGQSLDQLIKANGPLAWTRTLTIVQQVAEALDYAHAKGLVHRDIKPSNIIVGAGDRAVLTDFGLVRGAEQASLSTGSTGGILGTPEYIPPEVWEGQPATKASDIYALACVVYEMLLGHPLFAADTGAAVMRKHVLVGPEFPAHWPPDVPSDVAVVLRKALEREQNQRYSTASEFAVGLRECAGMQEAREARKMQDAEAAERKAREDQEREAARIAAEATILAAQRKQQDAERQARERQEVARAASAAAVSDVTDQLNTGVPRRETASPVASQPVTTKTRSASRPAWLIPVGGLMLLIAAVVVITSMQRPTPLAPAVEPTAISDPITPTEASTIVSSPTQSGGHPFAEPKQAFTPTITLMPSTTPSKTPFANSDGVIIYETPEIYLNVMKPDGTILPSFDVQSLKNPRPDISPDGKQKVFVEATTQGNPDSMQIFLSNIDGSGKRRLTNVSNGPVDSVWSPDGKYVYFNSAHNGQFGIYRILPDGSQEELLTPIESYDVLFAGSCFPAWSPSDSRLLFVSARDGKPEIYSMNPDGSDQIRLTTSSNPTGATSPVWSPDGTRIAFISLTGFGYGDVYVMAADGSNLKKLTSGVKASNSMLFWLRQ